MMDSTHCWGVTVSAVASIPLLEVKFVFDGTSPKISSSSGSVPRVWPSAGGAVSNRGLHRVAGHHGGPLCRQGEAATHSEQMSAVFFSLFFKSNTVRLRQPAVRLPFEKWFWTPGAVRGVNP